MKQLYTVPTDVLKGSPPNGHWHGVTCPGLPQWSLVVVEQWASDLAEDAWLLQANVTERYPENFGQPVPTVMVTAFGPWGVTGTDTLRDALKKIRAQWPAARL